MALRGGGHEILKKFLEKFLRDCSLVYGSFVGGLGVGIRRGGGVLAYVNKR